MRDSTSTIGTMNQTGHVDYTLRTNALYGTVILLSTVLSLYVKICIKIYLKHRGGLEPTHIFHLHFLMACAQIFSFALMVVFHKLIRKGNAAEDSCWHYFFGLFCLICFNTEVVLLQMDRFLAVYWNVKYKGRITSKIAKFSCIGSKVFSFILTLLVAILDPTYITFTAGFEELNLKTANIYLDAYPKIFVAIMLSIVSIYVALIKVRLDKKVTPAVHLPSVTVDSENGNPTFTIQRKDEDPNMFYEIEISKEEEEKIKSSNACEINAQGPEKREVSESPDNQEITCFTMNKDILLVAKEALSNNLITALLFIVIVPNRILSIIYYHMQPNIGEYAPYLLVNKIMLPFRIICIILHQVLILRKLAQN